MFQPKVHNSSTIHSYPCLSCLSLASAKDLAGRKHARSVLPGTDVERAPVGFMERVESVWRDHEKVTKPPSLFQHQLQFHTVSYALHLRHELELGGIFTRKAHRCTMIQYDTI